MSRPEKIMTCVFVALGFFFVGGGLYYGIGRFNSPKTGFIAFWVGLILAVLGAAHLFHNREQRRSNPEESFIPSGGRKALLFACGSLLLFLILFKPLGLILSSLLFLVFLVRFIGKESWRTAIVIGFCGTLFIYVLFVLLLSSSFPGGVLKDILPS